jgi:hypothetical protein
MTWGRCSGCGQEDASCKKIRNHAASCPEFLELFRRQPERAIDPEAEWARHHSPDGEAQRLDEREDRRAATKTRLQALAADRQSRSRDRWAGRSRNLSPTHVPPPPQGALAPTGHSEAARILSASLSLPDRGATA